MGRIEKKQSQLSDLYGALNIGQSIVFVNSRRLDLTSRSFGPRCCAGNGMKCLF